MLDLKFVRDNFDLVQTTAKNKNANVNFEGFLNLEKKRREILTRVEELKHTRNVVSKEISQLKKDKIDAADKIEQMRLVGDDIKKMDDDLAQIENELNEILRWIPNIPHESVPVGKDETNNKIVKEWGKKRTYDFKPLPHWEIGEKLGIMDLAVASKITGSGFIYLKGTGALLERALINFFLNMNTTEHGYMEVYPPYVVNRASMFGTGQLPKLEKDMYLANEDDFFLIPTAEVPVTNIHRDDVLAGDDLPIKYTAYSPCFRREAGAAGKDTRGLIRVHQFNKVEMVQFVHPDKSWEAHEELTGHAEHLLELLDLPYRRNLLCTGDLSFAAAKCYDLEVYTPGIDGWLEVSSCSNFTDFQARRANIRFKPTPSSKPLFVHTLNGSGLALPRIVISIMETYQTKEGKIQIPEVLQPYMNGRKIIE